MKASDKHKLIERIKTLEGLTDDERSALLGLLNETKTYGLVWEDKPEEVEERLRSELPVLKEVKSRSILNGGGNSLTPNHLIIEGDNLEALTTLTYTHEGKIDVIYIDPPYNTGNKDFIYNDSYVDSEDSYRHSKWLSFMSRRLRIAKRLLSDRGVIFISIDDNEYSNLSLLCDEIFKSNNCLGTIIWQHSVQPKGYDKFSIHHNYILCYRGGEDFELKPLPRTAEDNKAYKNPDNDPKGLWRSGDVRNALYRPNLIYDVITPSGKIIKPCDNGWRWSKETMQEKIRSGEIIFNQDETKIIRKIYLSSLEGRAPESIWFAKEVGSTREAMRELKDLFTKSPFDTPKPTKLIQRLLMLHSNNNAIILDFFAGSGTTLHAVMQLNAEDGGKRQCILCTNNENGICENVTYERNKRVIKGYTKPNGEAVEGLLSNNLRYYRTDFVGRRRTPQNMRRLMLLSSDMLCIKENLYTEHDEFGGMETMKNGFRYFADDKKRMLIVYNEEAIYDIVDALETMEVTAPIIVYVFSPGNDAWNSEFESVSDKVRLTALPAAIYNAYKRVLPKPKTTLLNPEEAPKEEKKMAENLFDFDEEGGEA